MTQEEEYQALAKVIRESDDLTLEVLRDHLSASVAGGQRPETLGERAEELALVVTELARR